MSAEFHEECGMPASMHTLVCPGPSPAVTPESLRRGHQPESLKELCGMAVGAATLIQYGPGYEDAFDSESAGHILDWLLEGIAKFTPQEMSSK